MYSVSVRNLQNTGAQAVGPGGQIVQVISLFFFVFFLEGGLFLLLTLLQVWR